MEDDNRNIRFDSESTNFTMPKVVLNRSAYGLNPHKRKIDATTILNVTNNKKARLDDLLTKMKEISVDLENGSSPKFNASPSYIEGGEMRNYQIVGLNWMIALHDHGLSGILADEMGLGKTLQTISLIGYLQLVRKVNGKFLVVVPLSTITNWETEFQRWCPSLVVVSLYGSDSVRQQLINVILNDEPSDWDVCLTTYESCKGKYSRKFVSTFRWYYVVMDEGTRIKSENSIVAQVVRHFKAEHRLILTGNNNLHELWALLSWLMPNDFQSSVEFDVWFDDTACLTTQDSVSSNLFALLKPISLRRLKTDVLNIEPCEEFNILVEVTSLQRDWYRKILKKNIEIVHGSSASESTKLNSLFMQLRKCTNHPYLFDGAEQGPPYVDGEHIVNNSGKMIVLDMLLARLKQRKSRVLIFSQFTRVLDIIEDYLNLRPEYEHSRIDGLINVDERTKRIAEFQDLQSNKVIFLLSSTSTAALGINLTAADSVIIYDTDWNPQIDLQAISRCHRIGQTKKVRVFRLFAKDTVEEKMMEPANLKLRLSDTVIESHVQTKASVVSKNFFLNAVRFGTDAMLSNDLSYDSVEWDKLVRRNSQKLVDQIFAN